MRLNLEDKITALVGEYGKEKVMNAAEELLNAAIKKVPAGYDSVVSPENVQFVIQAIDAAVADVVAEGEKVDSAYGERARLMKEKTTLETAVQLKEAEAIMQIQGEGRSQYVIWKGEKIALTNDTLRDSYRRSAAESEHRQLANVKAQLAEIEVNIMAAKDMYATAKEAADLLKAKAHVQGNLLKFLA
ncbi:hypothetical protein RJD11_12260 [Bacillus velezensis]|uniref:hypothetical protein n=1 Tax=Bacillus TaxID=1386 RepID=UPI001C528024|nr:MULTISPECIES: hypothetical protein [Bacillus amyloliquefaciens group]QXP95486.1 hypothetical protein KVY05_11850 [Bacillus velezensis]QXP99294.1 hypothetical protein KVY05_21250 [Bacillus velezensis]UHH01366.1 hypothetical protein LUA14_12185 [Bacillus amyloliquefaciens]ULR21113.1 hypothetical protein MJE83_12180 [Bacillus velezensis]UVW07856.1 hypothetical protein NX856_12220 [Bacillus velezensis]